MTKNEEYHWEPEGVQSGVQTGRYEYPRPHYYLGYTFVGKVLDSAYRFLDVFSGTGTISFTEKTQPEYLFRTLLPQCVSIMARLP